MLLIYIAMVIN